MTAKPKLALVGALALIGFATVPAAASAQAAGTVGQTQESSNWSGYVASGRSFSNVAGNWTVPAANPGSGDGYSAFWVGIGGASQGSQALEQVGTSSDVQNGQTSYYAWYELVPEPESRLNLAVHPGDQMTGRVTVNGSTVTVSLSDHTTGQSVTKTRTVANPDASSAEWIAEAPSSQTQDGNIQPLPLADFGRVTFTGASATSDGHTGPINDPGWSAQPVELSPSSSLGLLGGASRSDVVNGGSSSASAGATPTGLTGDGSSFSVGYSADGGAASQSQATATSGYGGDPGYGYGTGYGYSGGDGYVYVVPVY